GGVDAPGPGEARELRRAMGADDPDHGALQQAREGGRQRILGAAIAAPVTGRRDAPARRKSYDFGHTAFATAMLSGCTATGRPFCHCTMQSSAPTRRPVSSNVTPPPGEKR